MKKYTPKQILKFSQSYIQVLAGSNVSTVIRMHAQMAEIDLRYVKFEGPDIWDVNKVFSAANAQAKISVLLRIIEKDGFAISARTIEDNQASIPKLEEILVIGYLPSNIVVDFQELTFLRGKIENPSNSTIKAFLRVSINSVSDRVVVALDLPPGHSIIPRIRPPRFSLAEAKQIDQTVRLFSVNVELLITGEILVDSFQADIWVSQPDIVLIASQEADNVRDFSSLLSWWVNSGAEGISDFILKQLPEDVRSNLGYGFDVSIHSQVKSVYNAFREKKMLYMPTELIWIAKNSSILQRVRRPDEIMLSGTPAYNCLDGAILFASVLEKIGIAPLLVLLPTHALVGWKVDRKELTSPTEYLDLCNYLDVTGLASDINFEISIASAEGLLKKYRNCFTEKTKDIRKFSKIIDVKHSRGVPLNLY
jgi:hypothetical protein